MSIEISPDKEPNFDPEDVDWGRKVEDYLKNGKAVRRELRELNLQILKADGTSCPRIRWIRIGEDGERHYYDTFLEYKMVRFPWHKLQKWLNGEDRTFSSEKERLETLHRRCNDPFYQAVVNYINTFLDKNLNNEQGVFIKIMGLDSKHITELTTSDMNTRWVERVIEKVSRNLDGFPREMIRMYASGSLSKKGKRSMRKFYPIYIILIVIFFLPREAKKTTVPVVNMYAHLCDVLRNILKKIPEAGSCDVSTQLWLLEKSHWKYQELSNESFFKMNKMNMVNKNIQYGMMKKVSWIDEKCDSLMNDQTKIMETVIRINDESKRTKEYMLKEHDRVTHFMEIVGDVVAEKDKLVKEIREKLKQSEERAQKAEDKVDQLVSELNLIKRQYQYTYTEIIAKMNLMQTQIQMMKNKESSPGDDDGASNKKRKQLVY